MRQSRREWLIGAGFVAGGLASAGRAAAGAAAVAKVTGPAILAKLPIADPAFNVRAIGRLQGDLSGRQRWLYNPGFVFATVPGRGLAPGELGRLLYRVEGFTSRVSRLLPGGVVEERSQSYMVYRDATSDAYLTTFRNPFTGAELEVPAFRGGPSRSRLTPQGAILDGASGLESTALDQPVRMDWRVLGDTVFLTRHAASRIRTAAGAARNEFSVEAWTCQLADIANETATHIPSTGSWTSQAEWQGWLKMDGHAGGLLWRIEPSVLDAPSQFPRGFVAHIERLLPGKLTDKLSFDGE
jgi:hypothetical protein